MPDRNRISGTSASSPSAADLPISEWEAAFSGQQVGRDGLPNRKRREMHLARGMARAVERDDIEVAVVYFNRLHGIQRSTKEGA